jgi:hypothetical protein
MPTPTSAPKQSGAVLYRRPTSRLSGTASVVAVTLAAAALAGCTQPDKFAPACPQLTLLGDAADLTRFRPSGQDITDMVLDARITAVPAACSSIDRKTVKATLNVTMEFNRGPAASGPDAALRYFVAVTEDSRILDEQDYGLSTTFPTNVDRVTVTGQDITLDLPVTPDRSAAAYKVYVGFRLTPEQLAYNRSRGAR